MKAIANTWGAFNGASHGLVSICNIEKRRFFYVCYCVLTILYSSTIIMLNNFIRTTMLRLEICTSCFVCELKTYFRSRGKALKKRRTRFFVNFFQQSVRDFFDVFFMKVFFSKHVFFIRTSNFWLRLDVLIFPISDVLIDVFNTISHNKKLL